MVVKWVVNFKEGAIIINEKFYIDGINFIIKNFLGIMS